MLSKIAFKNAKRSFSDYIIYLITVSLAFSFIFAFNLIGNSKEIINLCDVMENFKYAITVVNIFVIISICFLINYTTKFMFQRRSKEFGTYMILGIKKNKITKLFTIENIILGLLSLLISFIVGYLFSLVASTIIMNIFSLPYLVKIDLSIKPICLSIIYFLITYLIVLLLSRRRIKKMKIIDLLNFDKQNEKRYIKNNKLPIIVFIISIILSILGFYIFDKSFTIGVDPSLLNISIAIVLITISIYTFVFSIREIILKLVLRNKKIKYKDNNLFIIRNITSKIKSMSFTIGTLTLLITLSLISLNISSLFKGMFDYQLDLYAPYDISIETDLEQIPKLESFIKQNYEIEDKLMYNSYLDSNNNIIKALNYEYGWRTNDLIIKLSDYNKLQVLKNDPQIILKEDEYLLHVTKELYEKLKSNESIKTITMENGYTLKQKDIITKDYTTAWGSGYGYVMVVSDEVVNNLKINSTHLIVNTTKPTTEKFANELVNMKENELCEEDEAGFNICYALSNITVRGMEEANNNSFITITAFLCFYISFIFIAIVGTILAIQALSDSSKYKYRYLVLNKLGVKKEKIHKTIFKQLLIFFCFPLVYPIIINLLILTSLNKIFKIALTTDTIYIYYFIVNIIFFIIIYLIYFATTHFSFKKNIEE